MQTTPASNRIHPLVAGAAVSVIVVSLLGAAAITGLIPHSEGKQADAAAVAAPAAQAVLAPPVLQETVQHKAAVHHPQAQPMQTVQAQTAHPQPVPAAENSPVGIGVGAVVGGLLGSQVGGGKGRTLATIAGAVGGGYVGNEIAKRNP